MEIIHIGLNISQPNEIENFYTDILGMAQTRMFTLNEGLSATLFNRPVPSVVYMLQKEDVVFEIFIADLGKMPSYAHVCISIDDRDKTLREAQSKNYECIRVEREGDDLVFIKDKAGNIFELKEKDD